MKNEVIKEKIIKMIYEIRDKQVMLDFDIAHLYKWEVKRIDDLIKKNNDKFSHELCFRLNNLEYNKLKFQSVSSISLTGRQRLPYALTEKGILMLASLLKNKEAIEISLKIIEAFVTRQKYFSNEVQYLSDLVIKHDQDIKLLQEAFNKLDPKGKVNEIYFKGQIYDAYSKIVDILKQGKREIIIVDGYADKQVLDMIRDLKVKVKLICKKKGHLKKLDIDKYKKQYNNLEIIYDDTFHDRYIIIDKVKIYHLGASLNHAGQKTFSINVLEDREIKKAIISKLKNKLLVNKKTFHYNIS